MTFKHPQTKVVVEWWANALKRPKFDNGDSGLSGSVGRMLASIAAGVDPQPEALERFKEALGKVVESRVDDLIAQWKSDGPHFGVLGLYTDYGPSGVLADAVDAAEIDYGRFPWKTVMFVYGDRVDVACGYGAERETIWRQ